MPVALQKHSILWFNSFSRFSPNKSIPQSAGSRCQRSASTVSSHSVRGAPCISCSGSRRKAGIAGAAKRGYLRPNDNGSSRLPNTRTPPDSNCTATKNKSWIGKKVDMLLEPVLLSLASQFNWSFTSLDDVYGQVLYNYYNWRQDTGSDLLLFVGFNIMLMFVAGTIKHLLVDGGQEQFWLDLYEVITLTFGQEFPSVEDAFPQQAFSVFVAAFGLAAFALVLALVEQLVLEVLEENVKRGSQVFEEGHVLILGWCDSRRDLELVGKVIDQLCWAYRTVGGTTVVVLTRKEKLEMENIFKRTLPVEQRYGTKLVFRQGNPLVPLDLKMVGASKAATTIIISDQSRSPDEADAQSLRCAILMSELTYPHGPPGSTPAMPAEGLQSVLSTEAGSFEQQGSDDTPPAIISNNILGLPPAARPIVFQVHKSSRSSGGSAHAAQSLNRFCQEDSVTVVAEPRQLPWQHLRHDATIEQRDGQSSGSSNYVATSSQDGVNDFIKFWGHQFNGNGNHAEDSHSSDSAGDGNSNATEDREVSMTLSSVDNPHAGDSLGSMDGATWTKVQRMIVVEMKTMNMTPLVRYACNHNVVPLPTGQINARRLATMVKTPHIAVTSQQMFSFENQSQVYMQHFPELAQTRFGEAAFRFPEGIVLGICNPCTKNVTINPKAEYQIQDDDQLIIVRPTDVAPDDYKPLAQPVHVSLGNWKPYPGVTEPRNVPRSAAGKMVAYNGRTASISFAAGPMGGMDLSFAASMSLLDSTTSDESGDEAVQSAAPPNYVHKPNWELIPGEYWEADTRPVRLLICGWAELSFMLDLLLELDAGQSRLPTGSNVVFANSHSCSLTVDRLARCHEVKNIRISHCQVDPLHRQELSRTVDIRTFHCAMVLCDQRWLDADMDNTNGYDILEENDMLRLDSLIMAVQLNIRKLLDQNKRPAINIICQKVATEGLTMFEDRNRLPLGISVNLTSFAAKIITNVAYNPQVLLPISKLYVDVVLTMVDASEYARKGEELTFWELMRRAQEKEHILLGYYAIPNHVFTALQTTINPMGMTERCIKKVWNNESGQLKFIIYKNKDKSGPPDALRSIGEEDFYINSRPANWVARANDPTLSAVAATPKVGVSATKNAVKR